MSTSPGSECSCLAGASCAACGRAVGSGLPSAMRTASFGENGLVSIAIGVYWIEVAPPCAGATVMKTLSPCVPFRKFMMVSLSGSALAEIRARCGCQPSAASSARVASVASATDLRTTNDVVNLLANSSCAPAMRGRRLASTMSASDCGASGLGASCAHMVPPAASAITPMNATTLPALGIVRFSKCTIFKTDPSPWIVPQSRTPLSRRTCDSLGRGGRQKGSRRAGAFGARRTPCAGPRDAAKLPMTRGAAHGARTRPLQVSCA